MEFINRDFVFPKMRFQIKPDIKNWIWCQQNKFAKHAKYGQVKFAWHDDTIDKFCNQSIQIKKPHNQKINYDNIMVIIDKLTKYAFMIPFKKNQFGFIILDELIKNYGIPTSDKNKFFKSNYWKILMWAIGTKLKMSTIYHPKYFNITSISNRTIGYRFCQ